MVLIQSFLRADHRQLHNVGSSTLNRRIQRCSLSRLASTTIRSEQLWEVASAAEQGFRVTAAASLRNQRLQKVMHFAKRGEVLILQLLSLMVTHLQTLC